MERRYQVFVSSTFLDLQDARKEVMQALLELKCIPSGMELFPAADEDQWSLIKKVIDDSDYYIVIIAGRYGSIGPDGHSYTEMEYRYATETGKPIIGFVHEDPGSLPSKSCEISDEGKAKLESFRSLVEQKMCRRWSSSADLGSKVSRSLIQLMQTKPAVGWVRANLVPDESAAEEILGLRRQLDELQQKIKIISLAEPEGTADLAKGDDGFTIHYTYFSFGNGRTANTVNGAGRESFAWDYIFSLLSPLMIDEASDFVLKEELENMALQHLNSKFTSETRPTKIMNFEVADADYQTVKIQFRALGYITKSERPRSVKDPHTYWTLTPLGDLVMTKLRAQRKQTSTTDLKNLKPR